MPDRRPTRPGEPEGFTIVEIMIAIFIFAIVITMLFSSHNLVLSNTASIKGGMDMVEVAKNCIDRMVADLQSIYLNLPPAYSPPDLDDPPEPYRVVGDKTTVETTDFARLRFTSSAHLSYGHNPSPDGIAEIVYYVQDAGENGTVLRRADHRYPFGEFEESEDDPILCVTIRSLEFTYYDEESTPYELWDSESPDFGHATPRVIGILLEIGDAAAPYRYETKVHLPVYRRKTG